ncbi:MAG TPA: glycosyltransferase [Candidatus Competibacter sp.]|nr:glycosyltransferase [Candidatus Competibacter sp.]
MQPNNNCKIMPFVSIIIPSYNESKYIRLCLESLRNLNYPEDKLEIIIIDNGSTDDTVVICSEYTSKIYIALNLTVAGLRNFGADKAIGKIYAFIDADCIADVDWLKNAIKVLKQEDNCVTGSKCNVPPDAGWVEKVWFSQKTKGRAEVVYINSGNLIIPKEIFNKIGGFNESLKTGEDYDLCLRAKKITKIISDNSVNVVHLGNPKTLGSFLKREIWHGLGSFSSLKNKWIDLPLFGTIIFLILFILQFFGLMIMFFSYTANIFLFSIIGLILLLVTTSIYRVKYVIKLKEFLQLTVLYYVYYLGRSIAFFYIFTRRDYTTYPITRRNDKPPK